MSKTLATISAIARRLRDIPTPSRRGEGTRQRLGKNEFHARITAVNGDQYSWKRVRYDAAAADGFSDFCTSSPGTTGTDNAVGINGATAEVGDVVVMKQIGADGDGLPIFGFGAGGNESSGNSGSEPGEGDCIEICASGVVSVPYDTASGAFVETIIAKDFGGRQVMASIVACRRASGQVDGSYDVPVLINNRTEAGVKAVTPDALDSFTNRTVALVVDKDDGNKLKLKATNAGNGNQNVARFMWVVAATTAQDCGCFKCGNISVDTDAPALGDIRVTTMRCWPEPDPTPDYVLGAFYEFTDLPVNVGPGKIDFTEPASGSNGAAYAYDPLTCNNACVTAGDPDLTYTGPNAGISLAYYCPDDEWAIDSTAGVVVNVPVERVTAANGWTVTQSDSTGLRATKLVTYGPGDTEWVCLELDIKDNEKCVSAP